MTLAQRFGLSSGLLSLAMAAAPGPAFATGGTSPGPTGAQVPSTEEPAGNAQKQKQKQKAEANASASSNSTATGGNSSSTSNGTVIGGDTSVTTGPTTATGGTGGAGGAGGQGGNGTGVGIGQGGSGGTATGGVATGGTGNGSVQTSVGGDDVRALSFVAPNTPVVQSILGNVMEKCVEQHSTGTGVNLFAFLAGGGFSHSEADQEKIDPICQADMMRLEAIAAQIRVDEYAAKAASDTRYKTILEGYKAELRGYDQCLREQGDQLRRQHDHEIRRTYAGRTTDATGREHAATEMDAMERSKPFKAAGVTSILAEQKLRKQGARRGRRGLQTTDILIEAYDGYLEEGNASLAERVRDKVADEKTLPMSNCKVPKPPTVDFDAARDGFTSLRDEYTLPELSAIVEVPVFEKDGSGKIARDEHGDPIVRDKRVVFMYGAWDQSLEMQANYAQWQVAESLRTGQAFAKLTEADMEACNEYVDAEFVECVDERHQRPEASPAP